MHEVINVIFYLLLFVMAIPIFTFSVQVLLSLPSFPKSDQQDTQSNAKIAVLIPAHNESAGLPDTLKSIKAACNNDVRIVVIADNCSDNTAEVARELGVEVVERFHETQRGKGYALDYGIKHISTLPPDVLMIFDADCIISQNAVNLLAYQATKYQRPIQALYLIQAKPGASVKAKLAEFAYVVKALARPLGYFRLGLPILLQGSGMAFPWELIKNANLANGYIVEDMKLGIELAIIKRAPMFCPQALVTSEFPLNEEGANSQRKRWEHGHIGMIINEGIPLLLKGIKALNLEMVAMALDLCVPPVALLFLLSTLLGLISTSIILFSSICFPWIYGVMLFGLLSTFVMIAWLKYGRAILPITDLITYAPIYAASKIQIYIKYFVNKQVEWVKSRRD